MIQRPFRHQAKCFLAVLGLYSTVHCTVYTTCETTTLVSAMNIPDIALCVSTAALRYYSLTCKEALRPPPLLTIPTSHKKAGALSAYTLFTWITKTHFFTHQDISLWCKEICPPLPLFPTPLFYRVEDKRVVSLVWHHLDSHLSCHHLEHHQYCWASYQICLTTKTKVAGYHEILLFQNV